MTRPTRIVVPDASVADLINANEKKRIERRQPVGERRRAVREREKMEARRSRRSTYDIPPDVKQFFKDLAGEQKMPASQIVAYALKKFAIEYADGKIKLERNKVHTRSMRYEYMLNIPERLEDF